MANTRELTREERKQNKRDARKGLKKVFRNFTAEQSKKFKENTRGGIKGLLLGTNIEND